MISRIFFLISGQDTSKGSLIKVPLHVSKDVLTKCLKIADLKYNQQEPEFVLPPAFNAQTFTNINPSKDVIKIFHYWNSVSTKTFLKLFWFYTLVFVKVQLF